jgi:hypothetical protein
VNCRKRRRLAELCFNVNLVRMLPGSDTTGFSQLCINLDL